MSYPAPGVVAHLGLTCMVRMETPAVTYEIERAKDELRRAVLGEQARQKAGGTSDVEALREASRKRSEQCAAMYLSSWWLKRMDYRCVSRSVRSKDLGK